MHTKSSDQTAVCGKEIDEYLDHCVMCNIGPFISARHARFNGTLAQAGRDAGYAVLMEQVVPEFGLKRRGRSGRETFEEAILDVEFFGHPTAPDKLLDGTIRHPAASHILDKAAVEVGAAAGEGVRSKMERYPPSGGKIVVPCAVETWGFADERLDELLQELATLAAQRQRDRGMVPSRWRARWRTMISIFLAMDIGKAILSSLSVHFRPERALRLRVS